MEDLLIAIEFEWDPEKDASNVAKHGVCFSEVVSVFSDKAAAIFADPVHSIIEIREIMIGRSAWNRLLVVSFTVRPPNIRIISARRANAKERQKHEGSKS